MRKKGLFKAEPPVRLVPLDDHALELMEKLREGEKVLVWVHNARYPEHHRFAFVVFQTIAEDLGMEVEDVLESIKYDTGRWDYVTLWDGTKKPRTHSIAFESMSQRDFQQFWKDTLAILKDRLPEGLYITVHNMVTQGTERGR